MVIELLSGISPKASQRSYRKKTRSSVKPKGVTRNNSTEESEVIRYYQGIEMTKSTRTVELLNKTSDREFDLDYKGVLIWL